MCFKTPANLSKQSMIPDITERRQIELELRVSEQKYRSLFERNPDGVFALDVQGRITVANPACATLSGYSVEELLGKSFVELCAPDQREKTMLKVRRTLSGEPPENLTTALIHKDGRRVELLITGGPVVVDGKVVAIHCAAKDVTEARKAESLLFRREREAKTLVENAPDIIERFDRQFRLIYVNPILAKITGIPAAAFIGKTKREMGMPPALCEIWERQLLQVFSTAQEADFEFDYLAPSGMMHLHARLVPEAAPDGAVESVMSIVRDITALKQAEGAMRKAKEDAELANRAKDHFMAILSHELRNPLTPVLATVSLLQQDERFDAQTREHLEVIRRNAELETRLIDDLLDVTRVGRGKVTLNRRPVELAPILRHAVEVCQPDIEARRLHFAIDIKDPPHLVHADAGRLQQVFWNILKNAVKFTPHDGSVTLRCWRDADHVRVEVRDNGVGMDPAALTRIFNAFAQADPSITRQFGGLGLGLAISKALVEMHSGTITAHSEGKGKGASFIVSLPLTSSPRLEAAAGSPPPRATSGGHRPATALRILLVEDHGDTARITTQLLTRQGHQVHAAADVATALELAGRQQFDLLLSDLGLPDGTGLDLLRGLRARGQTFPAIALSGYGQEQDIRQSLAAGFSLHLTKPVDVPRLAEAVGTLTGRTAALPSH